MEKAKKKPSKTKKPKDKGSSDSLLVQAKGIEPLIIALFVLIIYWIASAVMFFISYKYGRI